MERYNNYKVPEEWKDIIIFKCQRYGSVMARISYFKYLESV